MKLKINTLGGAAALPTGTLSIGFKNDRGEHTLELSRAAQEQLLLALLTSAPSDPTGPALRHFAPNGVGRFQLGQDVGLSFLVARQAGIHLVLKRPLASTVQKLIETFDDHSTWNLKGPTAH